MFDYIYNFEDRRDSSFEILCFLRQYLVDLSEVELSDLFNEVNSKHMDETSNLPVLAGNFEIIPKRSDVFILLLYGTSYFYQFTSVINRVVGVLNRRVAAPFIFI